eukprot:TRINITY_DN8758_c0_g1_i1.p1 TRINITY_DN8758_c0_g1~~TRINITY_DN8758_c0_g1_i1.p1  ORF type:complete len:810 (-),score=206.24 TRINITY_DN8758_c0_g1_i1:2033-4462(-)
MARFFDDDEEEDEVLPAALEFLFSQYSPELVAAMPALNLSKQQLTVLPNALLRFHQLQELDLSNNELTSTSPVILMELRQLRKLDLSNNRLAVLKEIVQLGVLPNLQELSVQGNPLPMGTQRIYLLQALLQKRLDRPALSTASSRRDYDQSPVEQSGIDLDNSFTSPRAAVSPIASASPYRPQRSTPQRFRRDVRVLSSQAPGKLSYFGVMPGARPTDVVDRLAKRLMEPVFYCDMNAAPVPRAGPFPWLKILDGVAITREDIDLALREKDTDSLQRKLAFGTKPFSSGKKTRSVARGGKRNKGIFDMRDVERDDEGDGGPAWHAHLQQREAERVARHVQRLVRYGRLDSSDEEEPETPRDDDDQLEAVPTALLEISVATREAVETAAGKTGLHVRTPVRLQVEEKQDSKASSVAVDYQVVKEVPTYDDIIPGQPSVLKVKPSVDLSALLTVEARQRRIQMRKMFAQQLPAHALAKKRAASTGPQHKNWGTRILEVPHERLDDALAILHVRNELDFPAFVAPSDDSPQDAKRLEDEDRRRAMASVHKERVASLNHRLDAIKNGELPRKKDQAPDELARLQQRRKNAEREARVELPTTRFRRERQAERQRAAMTGPATSAALAALAHTALGSVAKAFQGAAKAGALARKPPMRPFTAAASIDGSSDGKQPPRSTLGAKFHIEPVEDTLKRLKVNMSPHDLMVRATELRTTMETEMQHLARERNEWLAYEADFDDQMESGNTIFRPLRERQKDEPDKRVTIGDQSFTYADAFRTVHADTEAYRKHSAYRGFGTPSPQMRTSNERAMSSHRS